MFGVINSAATDGVGALTSATKSEIVKSISCPIAETMGIGKDLIEREIDSVLNTERASRDPPPRVISVTSGSGFMLVIFFYVRFVLSIVLFTVLWACVVSVGRTVLNI